MSLPRYQAHSNGKNPKIARSHHIVIHLLRSKVLMTPFRCLISWRRGFWPISALSIIIKM